MARDLQITSDGKRPSQKPKPGIKVWGYDRGRLSLTPPSEPYGRFSRVIASHRVRAKRGPMTGSAKQSRVVCAATEGRPGGRMHPGPPRKKLREERVDHRYRRDQPGLPCAVVYGLYELSPVNQRLPPSSARSLWSLATTWRLHGRARTTRLRRPRMRRSSHGTSLVHRIPLHVRDDAYAPDRTGMRRPYNGLRFRKSRMFFACRIDKVFGRALVGQISSTADLEQGAVMLQCSKLV